MPFWRAHPPSCSPLPERGGVARKGFTPARGGGPRPLVWGPRPGGARGGADGVWAPLRGRGGPLARMAFTAAVGESLGHFDGRQRPGVARGVLYVGVPGPVAALALDVAIGGV